MENSWNQIVVLLVVYIPLILISSPAIITPTQSQSTKELRPSEHGLAYQDNPTVTKADAPKMRSFFGGKGTRSASNVLLPEAKNLTGSSWWSSSSSSSSRGGVGGYHDHVRTALVVASLACGIVGAVLLAAAAAFLLLSRFRKQETTSASSTALTVYSTQVNQD